jgi:leucine dehydrogenase
MSLEVFEHLAAKNHEQVTFCYDEECGLRAIIAVHNTTLGPSLGGVRMWPYKSEEEALVDVLRLSRGMTFKSAAAGLNLGGGKAVIIGDPKRDRTEALFRSFGRFVEGLGGRYITAEDVGTDVRCMEWVRMETSYVTGISRALGGSGDPSPVTAVGTLMGMKACAKERWGSDSLQGRRVNVQGVGAVGYHLVKQLTENGARVTVCDINEDNLARVKREFEVSIVPPERIFDVEGHIFAPCALGGVLNDETIPRLRVEVVAGSANNVLAVEKRHGRALAERGILYAPDYVINAGGLINVANELEGYDQDRALKQAEGVYDILRKVFEIARQEDVPTNMAADNLALRRIAEIAKLRDVYVPTPRTARKRAAFSGVS